MKTKACLEFSFKKCRENFTLDMSSRFECGVTVLFGASGSGKTTLLRLLSGLEKPDSGSMIFADRCFSSSSSGVFLAPQEREFGYVSQHEPLLPHRDVLQNILFGAKRIPEAERLFRARELIKEVDLEGLESRLPRELSGGQRQRVAIARTLISCPKALLLDEPFSALDHASRFRLGELIVSLQRRFSFPVILVTHDLLDAMSLADRICVVVDGRIVQEGSPRDLMENPSHENVIALFTHNRLGRSWFANEIKF
jgi:molybdate transport system ATP-binding protein